MSKRITKHTLDERLEAVLNMMEGNRSIKKWRNNSESLLKQLKGGPQNIKEVAWQD